jgi:type 1 glutamine amidotransferase
MNLRFLALPLSTAFMAVAAVSSLSAESKPLHVLLVAGGCCHDYPAQVKILRDGIQARANIQVDVVLSPDKGTKPVFPMYANADWAKGYDLVIHDECAADITDKAIVANILNAHKTIPAVNLHCAMHSYRWGNYQAPVKEGADNARWYEYLGLQSSAHGAQKPIALAFVDKESPITKGMTDWTTINEELYNNKAFFGAHPLITGTQEVNGKVDKTMVAWTNEKFGARTFSTTIGHNNATVSDARYLDLVVRGALWSANKLNDDYLTPYKGPEGKFTTLDKPDAPAPAKDPKAKK